MSNLIKYPYVNMQGKEAKVICYESEEEKFQPLDAKKKVVMKTFEEVAKEEKERAQEETGDESFQEGLPVTNYDEVIEEKIQKAEEEAAAAIAEARQQANEIVEQANNRKNQILEEGRQEGITRGYEEGLLQAQEEIQAQKDELSGSPDLITSLLLVYMPSICVPNMYEALPITSATAVVRNRQSISTLDRKSVV